MSGDFFSEGRIQFIIFFVSVFLIGLIWAYRKDIETSKWLFKGAWKFLVGIIITFMLMQLIVKLIF